MEVQGSIRINELSNDYLKAMGLNKQQATTLSYRLYPLAGFRLEGIKESEIEKLIENGEVDGGTAGSRYYLSMLGARMINTDRPGASVRFIVGPAGGKQ